MIQSLFALILLVLVICDNARSDEIADAQAACTQYPPAANYVPGTPHKRTFEDCVSGERNRQADARALDDAELTRARNACLTQDQPGCDVVKTKWNARAAEIAAQRANDAAATQSDIAGLIKKFGGQ